jgi:TolB-like protein
VVITACIRVLQIVSGGDGMVEDIITALSRFRGLFVIARNSSFTYKGSAVDVKQVDRGLEVRFQQ